MIEWVVGELARNWSQSHQNMINFQIDGRIIKTSWRLPFIEMDVLSTCLMPSIWSKTPTFRLTFSNGEDANKVRDVGG